VSGRIGKLLIQAKVSDQKAFQNLQSYLPDFLTTPLAHTVMVAVGVIVGSLVVGGVLASGRLKVNRHDWARPKLQEYYAAIGRLTERLPANL
jgi:hypothetical protein